MTSVNLQGSSTAAVPLCSSKPTLRRCQFMRGSGGVVGRVPGRQTLARAEQQQKPGGPSEEERRLEALEASIRGKRPPPKIKIRNSAQDQQEKEDQNSAYAPWPEGQLLPLGWENMNGYQKTVELLYGRRGFLFWLNEIAYKSVFVLIGAWILFRFVGPGLGLYNLEGNFAPPPL
eukprot:CAMPEP_0202362094 /NCGR_PEP_ID=MMETSP1126-20121109/14396_1 /ASSEMBLY_ACC=CAM_ASM_000457 /TAXON_ID=3047 /ORGANISM="Dunaliella tertiolecta, Strain CCMP1320" /LENGTH=174 /DNA_ID=CAMNT_0048956181 /DNA_START=66 /DNA_END=590 /DNA_ORIENTATION=-